MEDRVSLYPGRVKMIPVAGQENTYDMVRADQPTQEGTPLNKASLLTDATAELYGLGADAAPDEVFEKASELVPVGAVFWRASDAVPPGYLVCDGSVISRADYAELFSVIGTVFGAGDGNSTFAIPDLRAKFIRGAGGSSGYRASFGATAEATSITTALINTSGSYAYPQMQNVDKTISSTIDGAECYRGSARPSLTYYAMRPYNVALLPIIKYRRGLL